jgi:predicted membrane protein
MHGWMIIKKFYWLIQFSINFSLSRALPSLLLLLLFYYFIIVVVSHSRRRRQVNENELKVNE